MLGANELADMAAMLEGKAVFDGPRYKLFRRTAEHDGKFYLDLCDDEWRAVEIDGQGWRVVSDPAVKFRRESDAPVADTRKDRRAGTPRAPVPLPEYPAGTVAAGGSVARRRLPAQWSLSRLEAVGGAGFAKTTTARAARDLIDPNAAPVEAEPRSTHNLAIAANNGWVICLDNLSAVKADLSDALCRMATGGGFATRTLYSDEDETIFDAQRPVILTSIEDIGTRSDLLERSLIIDLPTIRDGARKAEKKFWNQFERARPQILGALLDVVSGEESDACPQSNARRQLNCHGLPTSFSGARPPKRRWAWSPAPSRRRFGPIAKRPRGSRWNRHPPLRRYCGI